MDNFETRKCPVTGNPVNVRVLANRNDPAGLEYLKAELKSEQITGLFMHLRIILTK